VATELYPTPRARRRAVASFCMFDFANSSYTTLIITVAFSVYFREVVVNAPDNSGDRLWGLANFAAMFVVALTSPILGALADYSGRRKFFLIFTTLQTVVATALLFFVGPGQIVFAMVMYAIATVGFESGYVFYNAFLPDISTPKTIGRISGWAWAVGYIGGLLALALCYPWLKSELRDAATGGLIPAAIADRQFSFLMVAAFYLIFALPAFRWLRAPAPLEKLPRGSGYLKASFSRLAQTFHRLRQHRDTGKFILASLFYNDGITTVIIFSATFATVSFGFESEQIIYLFLVLNIVAFPGALGAGYAADRIGAKRTLMLTLVLWIGVLITGYLAHTRLLFWVMATGAAIGMGSTQSVSRAFMAQLSPPEREAEFFGFYVLSGKLASTVGPLLFGVISAASGSQRLAVLSLTPLFLIGLGLLATVRPPERHPLP